MLHLMLFPWTRYNPQGPTLVSTRERTPQVLYNLPIIRTRNKELCRIEDRADQGIVEGRVVYDLSRLSNYYLDLSVVRSSHDSIYRLDARTQGNQSRPTVVRLVTTRGFVSSPSEPRMVQHEVNPSLLHISSGTHRHTLRSSSAQCGI